MSGKGEKKRILFVSNTLGRAGAEAALLELLRQIDSSGYDVYLYVLMAQGELVGQLPSYVRLLNERFSSLSVLTGEGRCRMARTVFSSFWRNGSCLKKLRDVGGSLAGMVKNKDFQMSKLFWRMVSDGAKRFELTFDLAVAWLEGGSAYYVAEHVDACKKAAFIHTDYEKSGYTRRMDCACWSRYERIYTVSKEVKERFQAFYPEYAKRTEIFYNLVDKDRIRRLSREQGGFADNYDGFRILTVGRLTCQKGYDVAVQAMGILKAKGRRVRWYALGEGEQRGSLERRIKRMGLREDFLLLGSVENPYPYYAQADLYVHATRVEGKSIAIQEAQALGCAVIASDCSGNKGQIADGIDGVLCMLEPEALAACIIKLMDDEEKRRKLGKNAEAKIFPRERAEKLLELLA